MRTAAAAPAAPAAAAGGEEAQVEEGMAVDYAAVVEAERQVRHLDAVAHVLAAALGDS